MKWVPKMFFLYLVAFGVINHTLANKAPWCTAHHVVYHIDGRPWFQVAAENFPDKMNWSDAVQACGKLGDGWRLPTKGEMESIYNQLHDNGKNHFKPIKENIPDAYYWSSTQSDPNFAWCIYFGNGGFHRNYIVDLGWVRAVRTISPAKSIKSKPVKSKSSKKS